MTKQQIHREREQKINHLLTRLERHAESLQRIDKGDQILALLFRKTCEQIARCLRLAAVPEYRFQYIAGAAIV
jgi:hypothetical protein